MVYRRFLIWGLSALLGAALAEGAAAQTAAPSDGVERVTLEEFKALLAGKTPPVVIDVRAGATEKIRGAVNIPLGEIESRLGEIPRDREVVTYCA